MKLINGSLLYHALLKLKCIVCRDVLSVKKKKICFAIQYKSLKINLCLYVFVFFILLPENVKLFYRFVKRVH